MDTSNDILYRDYTLCINRARTMLSSEGLNGVCRWDMVNDATEAIANQMLKYDADGITIYTYGTKYRRYDNIADGGKVAAIFAREYPCGGRYTTDVLRAAINNYFERKDAGKTQKNGETIFVITDGEPHDPDGLRELLISTSHRVESATELAISFIQINPDSWVQDYYRELDDQLVEAGARYDIVDTVNYEDMKGRDLTEILKNAIFD